jgi:anti-sigma factor RsiW
MNLDDSTLIAYVDGELDSADAASIEAELADSPDLQTSVDRLRASRLGYQSAFATQKLPPMPASLLQNIEAMADEARRKQGGGSQQEPSDVRSFPQTQRTAQPSQGAPATQSAVASHSASAWRPATISPAEAASERASEPASRSASNSQPAPGLQSESTRQGAGLPQPGIVQVKPANAANGRLWLAAAFVAGAFCAGLVLQFGSALVHPSGSGAVSMAAGEASPWIRAAADYQRLYTRDTVADASVDMGASAKTVDAIRQVDGVALRVPDLRTAGIQFKSVARLRFNDKPLVQIVYLPAQGAPIALCVMKDSRPDQAIAQAQVNGMNVVSWRQNELSYALIGKPDSGDLGPIAQQISTSRVDAMFAQNDAVRALILASQN